VLRPTTYVHAENPIGEYSYELNYRFTAAYICITYRDVGKGREQDAEALPIGRPVRGESRTRKPCNFLEQLAIPYRQALIYTTSNALQLVQLRIAE
jgi:hypothetical protein